MTLNHYYNNVEELFNPLVEPDEPVYQSDLRLENIHTAIIPCPFAEEFKEHVNNKRFADSYIPTT